MTVCLISLKYEDATKVKTNVILKGVNRGELVG